MTQPPGHPLADRLVALAFMALISTPLVVHLAAPASTATGLENRALAERPDWPGSTAEWRSLPEDLNAWLSDRFGLRRELISLGARLAWLTRPEGNQRAVRGEDGWLFGGMNNALAMHKGLFPFAPGEARTWLAGAEAIADASAAAGADFAVLLPPNKHSIYGGRLPRHSPRVGGETRLDVLMRLGGDAGLLMVDPRPALIEQSPFEKVFYQTDSHWTDFGAYLGAQALVEALMRRGVPARPLPLDELDRTTVDDFRGDLYGLLGEADGAPETVDLLAARRPTPHRREELDAFDWRVFDAYRLRAEPSGRPRLLLIGDSFGLIMLKFLIESFDEVTFVHYRGGEVPLAAIEPGRYDVVVFEMVERMLSYPLRPDASPMETAD